jgi:hypothetical protein
VTHREQVPTVTNVLRGAAEGALRQFGLLGVALSAAGYAVGYASIWLYTRGLGVAPSDLQLANRDYLLLAAIWTLLLAAYGVGTVVLIAGSVPYSTNLLITSYLGLVLITLVGPWTPTVGVVLLVVVIILGGPLLLHLRHTVLRVPSIVGRIALIGLGALLPLFVGWTCLWWGQEIRDNPRLAEEGGPIALVFVVPATEGLVTLDAAELCVARLSDRVYIADDEVVVTTAAHPFRPRSCF